MTEYITKAQAIDEVWDAFTSHDDPDLGRVIEENIERLPAADVAPVVHAHWITDEDGDFWTCSNCRKFIYKNCARGYCPKCGAKMDGGE